MKKLLFIGNDTSYYKLFNEMTLYDIFFYGSAKNFQETNKQVIDMTSIDDPLGLKNLNHILRIMTPAIVVVQNTVHLTCQIISSIHKKDFKLFALLDVRYKNIQIEYINYLNNHLEGIIFVNEFAQAQLEGINIPSCVIPCGIDKTFFKLNKQDCRTYLQLDDEFTILFSGKNHVRNNLDILVKGFVEFLKRGNMGILILKCLENGAWDLKKLVKYEFDQAKMDGERKVFFIESFVTSSDLNKIYNASDVGINISSGTRFGLNTMEQASLGIPQIVTNFSGVACRINDIVVQTTVSKILTLQDDEPMCEIHFVNVQDVANALEYAKNNECLNKHVRYNWSDVAKELEIALK